MKKKSDDKIVIVSDNGQADIATVVQEDESAFYAQSDIQSYAIPKSDVKAHVGPNGRIYTLNADADYVQDTVRLAALEKSIVLRHITHFEKPNDDKQALKIKDIMLYALIGLLVLGVIIK